MDKPTTPPDRLSIDPRSRFFDSDVLERGIGIRFKGKERHNVVEYCISEGWARLPAGRSLDRYGNPMTLKVEGPVEVWFEDLEEDSGAESEEGADVTADRAPESDGESDD